MECDRASTYDEDDQGSLPGARLPRETSILTVAIVDEAPESPIGNCMLPPECIALELEIQACLEVQSSVCAFVCARVRGEEERSYDEKDEKSNSEFLCIGC